MFWRAFIVVLVPPLLAFLLSPASLLKPEPRIVLSETASTDFDAQMTAVRAEASSAMNDLQVAQSEREITTEMR